MPAEIATNSFTGVLEAHIKVQRADLLGEPIPLSEAGISIGGKKADIDVGFESDGKAVELIPYDLGGGVNFKVFADSDFKVKRLDRDTGEIDVFDHKGFLGKGDMVIVESGQDWCGYEIEKNETGDWQARELKIKPEFRMEKGISTYRNGWNIERNQNSTVEEVRFLVNDDGVEIENLNEEGMVKINGLAVNITDKEKIDLQMGDKMQIGEKGKVFVYAGMDGQEARFQSEEIWFRQAMEYELSVGQVVVVANNVNKKSVEIAKKKMEKIGFDVVDVVVREDKDNYRDFKVFGPNNEGEKGYWFWFGGKNGSLFEGKSEDRKHGNYDSGSSSLIVLGKKVDENKLRIVCYGDQVRRIKNKEIEGKEKGFSFSKIREALSDQFEKKGNWQVSLRQVIGPKAKELCQLVKPRSFKEGVMLTARLLIDIPHPVAVLGGLLLTTGTVSIVTVKEIATFLKGADADKGIKKTVTNYWEQTNLGKFFTEKDEASGKMKWSNEEKAYAALISTSLVLAVTGTSEIVSHFVKIPVLGKAVSMFVVRSLLQVATPNILAMVAQRKLFKETDSERAQEWMELTKGAISAFMTSSLIVSVVGSQALSYLGEKLEGEIEQVETLEVLSKRADKEGLQKVRGELAKIPAEVDNREWGSIGKASAVAVTSTVIPTVTPEPSVIPPQEPTPTETATPEVEFEWSAGEAIPENLVHSLMDSGKEVMLDTDGDGVPEKLFAVNLDDDELPEAWFNEKGETVLMEQPNGMIGWDRDNNGVFDEFFSWGNEDFKNMVLPDDEQGSSGGGPKVLASRINPGLADVAPGVIDVNGDNKMDFYQDVEGKWHLNKDQDDIDINNPEVEDTVVKVLDQVKDSNDDWQVQRVVFENNGEWTYGEDDEGNWVVKQGFMGADNLEDRQTLAFDTQGKGIMRFQLEMANIHSDWTPDEVAAGAFREFSAWQESGVSIDNFIAGLTGRDRPIAVKDYSSTGEGVVGWDDLALGERGGKHGLVMEALQQETQLTAGQAVEATSDLVLQIDVDAGTDLSNQPDFQQAVNRQVGEFAIRHVLEHEHGLSSREAQGAMTKIYFDLEFQITDPGRFVNKPVGALALNDLEAKVFSPFQNKLVTWRNFDWHQWLLQNGFINDDDNQ